jgi:hypothetical protein
MGYSMRGGIKDYWPDNTPTTLYINGESTLEELIEQGTQHFGDKFSFSNIIISSEHIHTSCLTYDCFDSSDYTTFTVLTLTESVDSTDGK